MGNYETCVSFLDISISINGDALATSISYKPTDSHSFLLFSSSHPNQTKQSIPYSQFLRLRRLCSDDKDFVIKYLEMRTFFVERGYQTHLLDSAIQKAFSNSRRDTLKPPLTFLMISSNPGGNDSRKRLEKRLTFKIGTKNSKWLTYFCILLCIIMHLLLFLSPDWFTFCHMIIFLI